LKHNILSTLKSDTSTLSNARKCSMFPLNCYHKRMGNKHIHQIIRVNKSIRDISSSTNENKSYACKSTYVVCFYFDWWINISKLWRGRVGFINLKYKLTKLK
jgi:hypothetical protein